MQGNGNDAKSYSIVVLVKQVPDMNALRIDHATGKPVMSGQKVVSSFDEYAIEAAIRLKEQHGGEVTVVSAGPPSAKDALTRALAMGADRGVLIPLDDPNALDTHAIDRILADQLKTMTYDNVLVGQNSDDYATGQVGPQVAELLGIPQVASVVKLEANGSALTLHRDTEEGQQAVEVGTPVLLMAMTGLNEPRYPSLNGIMAAKKKPIEQAPAPASAGDSRVTWTDPVAPERTSGGTILQDVPPADAAKQLVAWLKDQKLI
jgi:electron transfer flavoprotein beta subunit